MTNWFFPTTRKKIGEAIPGREYLVAHSKGLMKTSRSNHCAIE
ncbi:MAG: hypothetical protein CM15mP58_21810 [Burkholderiaceae bacterium]|nr:MAG: hypothetical protein CM15mP58_21810 [Burkholderiaceae bacterium]